MKKILITLATLVTLSVAWSCKESFLTVIPQNGSITDVDFFKTTEDFDAFIFGAYAELQGVADMISIPSSLMQDVITENAAAVLPVYMSASNDAFYHKFWLPLYNISNRSNTILEKVAAAPQADRARIEGEAKFLRGFAYFNLARAFGTVPLILKSYTFEQDKTACTEEDKIWDQVIADLTDAGRLMPTRAQWGEANLGRATKGTAFAFLANAYMYKKDWANAAAASESLIALGEYGLMPGVRDPFSRKTENSIESIFEIQFRDDNNFNWSGNYNKGSLLPKLTAPAAAGDQHAPGGGWGSFAFSRKYADSFDPADERRKELVKIAGETYQGEDMATPFVLPGDPAEAKNAYSTKYWRGAKVGANDLLNPQNTPYFRYAEFLLNYAEILFEQGKAPEAYAQLNKVRHRARLPSLAVATDRETFMRALMDERRWELGMEPNIWFHYTRTGRAGAFLAREYNVTFNAAWFKFPIPQKDRNVNPNLCQNEGY
jgi:hypothetical protein